MKLHENFFGTLKFEMEGNEASENQEFNEVMANYRMVRQGSRVLFYNIYNHKLDACLNVGDNSFFICQPDGLKIAKQFGAKRFVVGDARLNLNDAQITQEKMVKFSRDRSFPLKSSEEAHTIPFTIVSLPELLRIKNQNIDQLYTDFSELFNRCANFTPGKQSEYADNGDKADKFCRFNPENNKTTSAANTVQVFLLDDKKKIVGTCSAMMISENGITDIYFYDEIVDYFTKLNQQESADVNQLSEELRQIEAQLTTQQDDKPALEAKRDMLKQSLASIIEPKRTELMASLFAAIRQNIRKSILELQPQLSDRDLDQMIESGKIRPFIRAAAERVEAYQQLGCGRENTNNFVIHGPRTKYAEMLDAYIKSWASQKLAACLQPQFSNAAAMAAHRYGSPARTAASAAASPALTSTNQRKM